MASEIPTHMLNLQAKKNKFLQALPKIKNILAKKKYFISNLKYIIFVLRALVISGLFINTHFVTRKVLYTWVNLVKTKI